jgi:hypothetical protein
MRPLRRLALSLLLAAVAGLSGCTTAPDKATPMAIAAGDCAQGFVEVTPAASGCGFALTAAGTLLREGRAIADPLIVSYRQDAGGSTAIAAGKVVLFPPSPSGRFRILQACESAAADALCWKVFVLDRTTDRLDEAVAGKYGPDRRQSWSPDERHVALVSRTDGASWIHVVEAASGRSIAFPGDAAGETWQVRPETLAWTGPRSLTVTAARCPGCAAAAQDIRF